MSLVRGGERSGEEKEIQSDDFPSLFYFRSKRDEQAEKLWLKNNPGGDIKMRRFAFSPSLDPLRRSRR